MLTIRELAENPCSLKRTIHVPIRGTTVFRPLETDDGELVREFLVSLSEETRCFWHREGYDRPASAEMCGAVGRFDKLRLIAQDSSAPFAMQALMEFSFSLPEGDRQRFRSHGFSLSESTDCRFGPCVRDDMRGTGLAAGLMPGVIECARLFGKTRIILWGGVLSVNRRAVRFYEKQGFLIAGRFFNSAGDENIDMFLDIS